MNRWLVRPWLWLGCLVVLVASATPGCFLDAPDLSGWFCETNADCLEPLICQKQACLKPCFNDQDCLAGSPCTNGVCTVNRPPVDGGPTDQPCQPTAKEVCDGKDNNCNGQIDEGINCADEGEACDLAASPAIPCKPGMSCLTFNPIRPRLCLRLCDFNNAKSCPDARFVCQQLGSVGVCVESPCTAGNCSYNAKVPHTCDSVGQGQMICRPYYPDGNVPFGGACSPTQGQHCKPPYKCARRSTDLLGFCTTVCSTPGSQGTCPSGSTCDKFEGIFNVCYPPCKSNADCPTQMSCQGGLCRHGG